MQPLASALAALLSLVALQASLTPPAPAKSDPKPAETKPAETRPAAKSPPNFVFIQAEATGWSSTSVDMDGEPPSHARPKGLTPNLEAMSAEGMRFSDFYASCPRCTPSRASFVTGISPAKLHMTYQNEGGNSRREQGDGGYTLMKMVPPEVEEYIPKGVKTTAEWLKELGYTSAHFGKWHAGRADPKANGFDASDGPNSNQGPERGVAPNPKQATVITDKGIAFMREAAKAGKPFYVQISHYGFGSEEEATPESLAFAKSLVSGVSGKPMGAIAGQHVVDQQIGRVRAALKEMGIDDNTHIFFSADHGAQGGGGGGGGGRGGRNSANPPFSGAKGSVSEGGIRVPFIVVGPGVPAGVVSRVRATGMDLVPTMRDLAGKPIEKAADPDAQTAVEGGSLAPVLRSSGENAGKGTVARTREEIVIHFPHYDLNNGGPASAIYLGEYKLVRNYDAGTVKLYDIAKDRAESNDLAASMPERVKELEAKLDAYLKAIKAPMATPAPKGGAGGEKPSAEKPAGEQRPADRPRRGGGGGGGGGRGEGGGGRNKPSQGGGA